MGNKKLWRTFWTKWWQKKGAEVEWDEVSQVQYEAIKTVIPSPANLVILEAGSGTGRVSIQLAAEGANVVLLDLSLEALRLSQVLAGKKQIPVRLVSGSIFALPFKDNTFDVVWNGGVLEHYSEEQQRRALTEMTRICRLGGQVIVIVPFFHAIFYRFAKHYLKCRGKWEFGYEEPLKTLAHLCPENAMLVGEFDVGKELHLKWLRSFDFLPIFFRRPELYPRFYSWLLKRVRGYLLVSVMRKTSS